jgi:tetratricopeptide (TPR) repeat protein
MNRILFFIILSFFFHSELIGKELNQFEKLAVKYAEVIGDVELGNVAFSKMNKRCKTKFENSSEFLFEADYYLRKNTGYTFEEFVQFMDREKETDTLASQLVEELIQQNGGCNTTVLDHWFKFVANYNEENHLVFLRQNKTLFGLPKIVRTDNQIEKAFNQKIKEYKNLPYKELFDLASALEHGSYSYSMFGLSQSITKNIEQSLEIWRFSIEKFNEPQAYYYIGKLLQNSSTRDAFSAFEQSAKQGYKYGEIWLGTYYACNKDTIKARYWLDIAKKDYKDPDYIDDIYAEIDELGMPTNCMDGWVY